MEVPFSIAEDGLFHRRCERVMFGKKTRTSSNLSGLKLKTLVFHKRSFKRHQIVFLPSADEVEEGRWMFGAVMCESVLSSHGFYTVSKAQVQFIFTRKVLLFMSEATRP